jgi:hypothetical protein
MAEKAEAALGRLRRKPALAAALFYALLSSLLFSPALVPGRSLSASDLLWRSAPWSATAPRGIPPFGSNSELADSVQYFEPFLERSRATLPNIPLWNPYIMGGRPYLANGQSAVFSPFSVPAYVLPFWKSFAVIAVLKLFVAAFGTYLLGRALGMRFAGALLAGASFGFSLWMVAWVSWPLSSTLAYLPFLCLLADRMVRRPGPLPAAGMALVVTLQYLAGHPETSFHVLLFAVLFWTMRVAAASPSGARFVASRALALIGALLLGTALAAVALVPFAELLSHSVDINSRGPRHEPSTFLLGVFLHDFWGRQTRINLVFPFSAMQERAYYLGAMALMLATAAVVLGSRWERYVLAGVAACALALATGIEPLFSIVTQLPGFDTANNARLAALSVFCVALLAGFGLDDLIATAASRRRRKLVLGAACGAVLAFPVVVMVIGGTLSLERPGSALRIAWGFADPASLSLSSSDVDGTVHLAALLEWLVFAVAALGLVVLRLRGRIGSIFAALAVGLLVAELFKAGMGWNPSIPTEHAKQPPTAAIRYLQAQRPRRFAAFNPPPFSVVAPLSPNVALRYGLHDARGYDFPIERRYLELWRRHIATSRDCGFTNCSQSVAATDSALRALGLLGVSHLLQDPRQEPRRSGLRVMYAGADARIYANPHALPPAFLVDRQLVAPDEVALASLGAGRVNPRSVVVTDRRLPGLVEGAPARAKAVGRAHIQTYEPERVVVRTTSKRDALLVLPDTHFPGWRATVDGQEASVRRVDYLLRGVLVPAGPHRVELRYEPASWRAGVIVSGVALLVLVALILRGWHRRTPERRPSD